MPRTPNPPTGRPAEVSEADLMALCEGLVTRASSGLGLGGTVDEVWARIDAGEDPLGELFCRLRPAEERRNRGATYTPAPIVRAMLDRAGAHATPDRVVDLGAGSGRFLVEAGRRFPLASLVGIELDPLAASLARAHLAASGLAGRSTLILADYRDTILPPIGGLTLFIGNPPYVRHHLIEPRWKDWLVREAARLGRLASRLSGLHVHFFLATALKARPGDFGAFITAAEWLDVNYGRLVRGLFLDELGGRALAVIEPTALPFPDAATTAAIADFVVGGRPATVSLSRVASVDDLEKPDLGIAVPRERLEAEPRWSRLTRPARVGPSGFVELGELCRVHRGQVTGANKVWIAGEDGSGLPPSVLFASVTRARELFEAGRVLVDPRPLRRVVDLPVDLDALALNLDPADRAAVDRFLDRARAMGVPEGYIASNRKAWWSVGLREPAPVLATYMARRPPAFVLNWAGARHLNIAHGLYPRGPMGDVEMANLVAYLASSTSLDDGRTYAGGLTKFEPGEMERLLVPGPDLLGIADPDQNLGTSLARSL